MDVREIKEELFRTIKEDVNWFSQKKEKKEKKRKKEILIGIFPPLSEKGANVHELVHDHAHISTFTYTTVSAHFMQPYRTAIFGI